MRADVYCTQTGRYPDLEGEGGVGLINHCMMRKRAICSYTFHNYAETKKTIKTWPRRTQRLRVPLA